MERGHRVLVYCRPNDGADAISSYEGMQLVHLPAVPQKALETLSHTGLSVGHLLAQHRPDVAVVFNAANAPFLPFLRARGVPVACHVDGLEWKRSKWGTAGRRYYCAAEALAVRWSDALIADARGIADYYRAEFDASSELIAYGAPILSGLGTDHITRMGLTPREFHLVVARFEPENHVREIVDGFRRSPARHPLVVVGSAPYSDRYTASIRSLVAGEPRVRLVGSIWDQSQLDELYFHALAYLHGHSVGGTNPSLLRAMGAGTSVAAFDVVFNNEVLGEDGRYFGGATELAAQLGQIEADPAGTVASGRRLQQRAAARYNWDDVADRYEELFSRLRRGETQHGRASGRRAHGTRRRWEQPA